MKQIQCINCLASIGNQAKISLDNGLSGRIIGVYSESFYCELDNSKILILHDYCRGQIPFGVAIKDIKRLLHTLTFSSGFTIHCNRGGLLVSESQTYLSFHYISPKYLHEKNYTTLAGRTTIEKNLETAIASLKMKKGSSGITGLVNMIDHLLEGSKGLALSELNVFCRRSYSPLASLIVGLRENSYFDIAMSLDKLLGLGVGLTPSADDVLVGILYALNFINKRIVKVALGLQRFQQYVLSVSDKRTSIISSAYLKAAAMGDEFSILDKAVYKILYHNKAFNADSFDFILDVGNNSGSEMLLGIILAIKLTMT